MDIAQEELKHFLEYDPATGVFTRIRAGSPRHASKIGKPCGTINKVLGYVEINVGGRNHYGHRLAWIYVHGCIPEGARIDHEDWNRANNRLTNLRCATHAQNLQNCKTRTDNTSGVKGVWWDAARQQWAAGVGKRKLGRFGTLLDAACARKSAALLRHGEFAAE